MDAVVFAMRSLHHQIHVSIVPMGDRGKFENINAALAAAPWPLSDYDWVIVADDDIKMPDRFLDMFIGACEASALQIAQPAHRYCSHWSWAITQRAWGSAVRKSRFVEIGPVTAFARASFPALLPFPALRWGWGLDLYWSELASRHGLSMGIVDAVAVEHLNAPASGYSGAKAAEEAEAFLRWQGVKVGAAELMKETTVVKPWRDGRPWGGEAE